MGDVKHRERFYGDDVGVVGDEIRNWQNLSIKQLFYVRPDGVRRSCEDVLPRPPDAPFVLVSGSPRCATARRPFRHRLVNRGPPGRPAELPRSFRPKSLWSTSSLYKCLPLLECGLQTLCLLRAFDDETVSFGSGEALTHSNGIKGLDQAATGMLTLTFACQYEVPPCRSSSRW